MATVLSRPGQELQTGAVDLLVIEQYGGEVEGTFAKQSFMRNYVKIKSIRGTNVLVNDRIGGATLGVVTAGTRPDSTGVDFDNISVKIDTIVIARNNMALNRVSPYFFLVIGEHMTELQAVNMMLSAIGVSPVSTIVSQHPDVLSSRLLLGQAKSEVLEGGKWFNTDLCTTLYKDSSGFVFLPSNCINVLAQGNYLQRGTQMYNNNTHTFVFDTDVIADVIIDIAFDDLPVVAQTLIMYSAAHALQANFVGDERKLSNLLGRFKLAQQRFNDAELTHSKYNALNTPTTMKVLAGIRKSGTTYGVFL